MLFSISFVSIYVDILIPICLISISISQGLQTWMGKRCYLLGHLKTPSPYLKLKEIGFVAKVMLQQQASANPREHQRHLQGVN